MTGYDLTELAGVLSTYVSDHIGAKSSYKWEIHENVWEKLKTGFDHEKYSNDLPRQNIELKKHLASYWATASLDEKITIATWIVRDWGGIRRNSEMTVLGYVNQADAERPATPFRGISSYSKILAIKDPKKYAIFDARVAASLNAIQLLAIRKAESRAPQPIFFAAPESQNKTIRKFCSAASSKALKNKGFVPLAYDEIYGRYIELLKQMHRTVGRSILEIEMFLFAEAERICVEIPPKI